VLYLLIDAARNKNFARVGDPLDSAGTNDASLRLLDQAIGCRVPIPQKHGD